MQRYEEKRKKMQDAEDRFGTLVELRITNCQLLLNKFPFLKIFFGTLGESKYHVCNECQYQTLNKSNMLYHVVAKHLKVRPYGCQMCDTSASSYANMIQHYRRVHKCDATEASASFHCSDCWRKFSMPLNLLDHYLEQHFNSESLNTVSAVTAAAAAAAAEAAAQAAGRGDEHHHHQLHHPEEHGVVTGEHHDDSVKEHKVDHHHGEMQGEADLIAPIGDNRMPSNANVARGMPDPKNRNKRKHME